MESHQSPSRIRLNDQPKIESMLRQAIADRKQRPQDFTIYSKENFLLITNPEPRSAVNQPQVRRQDNDEKTGPTAWTRVNASLKKLTAQESSNTRQ